ncbi:MAG: methyltransferase domain-containing protein [Candidatus Lokiarchaeota archaeon]|nr:methyltransferase domain-containing protein [Candidatus Lokiarchaeota archaeon]
MPKKIDVSYLIDHLTINDISDLSLMEILTLNLLLKYPKPVVRYTLYLDVKNSLKSKSMETEFTIERDLGGSEARFYKFLIEIKKLSTSSFYHSLTNLEKKGLVRFNRNSSNKIKTVESTKLTRDVVNFIFKSYTSLIIDDFQFEQNLAEEINRRFEKKQFDMAMIIWLKDYIELGLIEFFQTHVNQLYFLGNDSIISNIEKFNIPGLQYSRFHNKMIREPDGIYDLIVLPNYNSNIDISGINRIDLLKEVSRIAKKGGKIILITRSDVELTTNFYANRLLSLYREMIESKGRLFTPRELEEDLKKADLNIIEIFDYQGLLIGLVSAK